MRWLPVALIFILLFLQASWWLGPNGKSENQVVAAKVEQAKAENEVLAQRNQALAAQVLDLQEGDSAIEEVARERLGLVKPGETFVLMPEQQ